LPFLIPNLSTKERQELLQALNYLNLAEIKSFCNKHSIPYTIVFETADGNRSKTTDVDRKGLILNRMRHFLKTGEILGETCFRSTVVCFDALPRKLVASDRLFYGQFSKKNRTLIALLRNLTHGKFADGAIARILAREYWTRGDAPTLKEYASAWLEAQREHTKPNPEWAFLSDRAYKTVGSDWKKMRTSKAKRVIKILNTITATKRPRK
jgi:hypothetical protein